MAPSHTHRTRARRRNLIGAATSSLNAVMAFVYVVAGLLCAALPAAERMLATPGRQIFGGVLVLYGLLRGWRAWRNWPRESHNLGRSFRDR